MKLFNDIIDENEEEIRDELFNMYIQEYDKMTEDEIHSLIDQKLVQVKYEIGKII
jgi:hypothetical protein